MYKKVNGNVIHTNIINRDTHHFSKLQILYTIIHILANEWTFVINNFAETDNPLVQHPLTVNKVGRDTHVAYIWFYMEVHISVINDTLWLVATNISFVVVFSLACLFKHSGIIVFHEGLRNCDSKVCTNLWKLALSTVVKGISSAMIIFAKTSLNIFLLYWEIDNFLICVPSMAIKLS